MPESIKRSIEPYQDSYSPNGIIGEKDACGVGFIAVSYTHLTLPTTPYV